MICAECRAAATESLRVIRSGSNAPMGSLFSAQAMGRHKKCKGGTWCDCRHQVPAEGQRTVEPAEVQVPEAGGEE